jgi:hypothetical protein
MSLKDDKHYAERRELFEGDKAFLNDYLKESNIAWKLEDIVQWARDNGLKKKNKKLANLISENVTKDFSSGESDFSQFRFEVKEKRFLQKDYCHVSVRAKVTSERDDSYNRIADSERRVTWTYEGGSEAEHSGVHFGEDGIEEEQMLVLFKKVLVDLVEK